MIVQSITLHNFRNYTDSTIPLHPQLTIIFGPNAQGKTNLLEGIFTALHAYGFRESKEDELIRWNTNEMYVETVEKEKNTSFLFQIVFRLGNSGLVKKLLIQKAPTHTAHYLEMQTRSVLFAPNHIDIITGTPDMRRNYIDSCILSMNPRYKTILRNYEQALRKRNKVLEHHNNIATLREEIEFWNTYLQQQADVIFSERQQYCTFLNTQPHLEQREYTIAYTANRFTKERCMQYFQDEQRFRRTLIGPQKDDFIIYQINHQKQDLHIFGSRSEQRLGVFWLKYNEIRYITEQKKSKPILLLDDVFSELDKVNKELVLRLITQYQTVLTTTEPEIPELTSAEKHIVRL